MKPNPYINISETELIKKYNSFSAPCEESKSILTYLWNNYQSFIVKQCRQYFSTSCKFRFIGSPIPLATDQCFRL